jgi:hypothetical protein
LWDVNNSECIFNMQNAHEDFVWCLQMFKDNILTSGGADSSSNISNRIVLFNQTFIFKSNFGI